MVLQVFVAPGCALCGRALELAAQARARFPSVQVDVVDLSDPSAEAPESVFAVPTFVLDGQVLSLGNPRPAELLRQLTAQVAAREE